MAYSQYQDLARECESLIALDRVEFAQTLKKLNPGSGACFIKLGSGYAVFTGVNSPLTKAAAIGFDDNFDPEQITEFEKFCSVNNCPAVIEVSQLAGLDLTKELVKRGFVISEYTNALVLKIESGLVHNEKSLDDIKIVGDDDLDDYIRTTTDGFLNFNAKTDVPDEKMQLFRQESDIISQVFYHQPNSVCFIAVYENQPAGSAAFFTYKDSSLFLGTTTLPAYRLRGIQTNLIKKRINYAGSKNISSVYSITYPGSLSQHNLEKAGFRVLCGRVTFRKELQQLDR